MKRVNKVLGLVVAVTLVFGITAGAVATGHWADKYYNSVNSMGVPIYEQRYDDRISRGEMFAIIDRTLKAVDPNEQALDLASLNTRLDELEATNKLLEGRVITLEAKVLTLETEVDNLTLTVNGNTINIATNVSDIATNVTNVIAIDTELNGDDIQLINWLLVAQDPTKTQAEKDTAMSNLTNYLQGK